jgi:hypothetical protein
VHPSFALIAWSALLFWTLGQLWFCQIVIYPLFAKVGDADYIAYHRFYSRRIPLVVILPGFACFLLPLPLAIYDPHVPPWMSLVNIVFGVVALLVTVLWAIPRHNRLEKHGKDDTAIAELIRYNWLRTAAMTGQAIVTGLMLIHTAKLSA